MSNLIVLLILLSFPTAPRFFVRGICPIQCRRRAIREEGIAGRKWLINAKNGEPRCLKTGMAVRFGATHERGCNSYEQFVDWRFDCTCCIAMLENKELQPQQPEDDYSPKKYTLRSSAITTIKVTLLGGGALAAVWLLDMLVAN